MHHPRGFAVVGVAASITLDDNGACQCEYRITGVSAKAYRATTVESRLNGKGLLTIRQSPQRCACH